ncbi:hypothetical protein SAMN06295912_102232 [Sphingomonas laterariae]|uniref:Bro-N domain-containing protein n=1 Tax=Edaphosphingomonas laterariae TaxID=861865 RepID=A0A239CKG1_9SPHN|nr:hypothetical protein SAMN06295912_102232 [Sphingomonas laterariae]
MTLVSEPGALQIILRSDAALKPGTSAYRLRRLVTHEVLPSIRKHGCYPPPAIDPIAADSLYDGIEKSVGDRFREERLRWEAESGKPLAALPGFSTPIIRAIEQGHGGIRKGKRIEVLIYAEIDVLYVLTGRRQITGQERRVINAMRDGGDVLRSTVLARANAIKLLASNA